MLGKNVKLSNSILMDGVKIEDDCTLILFEFLSYKDLHTYIETGTIQDTILCTNVKVKKRLQHQGQSDWC